MIYEDIESSCLYLGFRSQELGPKLMDLNLSLGTQLGGGGITREQGVKGEPQQQRIHTLILNS